MRIYDLWDNLNTELLTGSLVKEEILQATKSESSSILDQIRKRLIVKSRWILVCIMLFSILLLFSKGKFQAISVIIFFDVIYLIGFVVFRFVIVQLESTFIQNENILQNLVQCKVRMQNALEFEKYLFSFGSPLIILCGSLWPHLRKGDTLANLLCNNEFLISIAFISIISTPIIFFLGHYWNQKRFGPYFRNLNIHILQLSREEAIK